MTTSKLKIPNFLTASGTKQRTLLSAAQCSGLENDFVKRGAYIDRFRRNDLAAELKLSSKQVRVWFRNRRIKRIKKLNVNQSKHELEMRKKSRPTIQPEVANPLTTANQPEVSSSTILPMIGSLAYLMGEMNVTDQIDYCENLAHDLSCCTKQNFQSLEYKRFSNVGPIITHSNISSPDTTSSSFDYEYDFFTEYN